MGLSRLLSFLWWVLPLAVFLLVVVLAILGISARWLVPAVFGVVLGALGAGITVLRWEIAERRERRDSDGRATES
jgi:hypothetical protein